MDSEKHGGGLVKCPACRGECFVLVRPRYEGFRKVGEERVCAGCGHVLDPGAHVAPPPPPPAVFGPGDRSAVPNPFRDDPRGRLCRYCRHYVVNPFRQWCGLHRREVEATETCDRFEPSGEPPDEAPAP